MRKFNFKINKKKIGLNYPTYFIADIAANHDGNFQQLILLILQKSVELMLQNFSILMLKQLLAIKLLVKCPLNFHIKVLGKNQFMMFIDASKRMDKKLELECKRIGIDFFTAPYSLI